YLDFAVYNASWNGTHVIPDKNITKWIKNYDWTDQGEVGWKTINITSPEGFGGVIFLDPNNTDNETFFVVIGQDSTVSRAFSWAYTEDPAGDDGYGPAYRLVSGFPALPVDYSMRVYLSPSGTGDPEVPLPSEINLRINGTAVSDSGGEGKGTWSGGGFGVTNSLIFDFDSTWPGSVSFSVTVEVYGTNLYGSILLSTLLQGYSLGLLIQNKEQGDTFLILAAIGAVALAGASGYHINKRRKIPRNAMKNLESILVDHNPTGSLVWSFDFVSMQQDIALVSGFMTAIKSFLEEMKIGGLKRLGTEFGTFIREESELLTCTCITGEIGLDEELWIRSKLHEFLVQIEQAHWKQFEDWKGEVAQFREVFPATLGTLIDLDKVRKLQRQKVEELTKKREKLQKKVNKYGARLEELKSKYDSGEIDFKKYIVERYKTEAKYDKVQKDYIYTSLFLSRVTSTPGAALAAPEAEKIKKIQKRFLQVKKEIEELQRREREGVITSKDVERKEKLQKELLKLMDELDRLKRK
nr:hypothetical protein [Candidatus Freyarchaeota archaeon]